MAVLWQYYGGIIAVVSQYGGSTMAVLWQYYGGIIVVLWQHYGSTVVVLWWYYSSAMAVLWLCCGGTMAVFGSTMAVLWHYWAMFGSTMAVFQQQCVDSVSTFPISLEGLKKWKSIDQVDQIRLLIWWVTGSGRKTETLCIEMDPIF